MYPQGRMSHHFRELRDGDYLAVKGPKVDITFLFRVRNVSLSLLSLLSYQLVYMYFIIELRAG